MSGNHRFSFYRVSAVVLAATAALDAYAQAAGEQALPEVKVQGQVERADGPVDGYRATRSGTATKTDTPLKEIPASITVVPAQLMKDQAMQSMGDVFRYVPGVLLHQGEGNRDQIIIRGNSTTADFYVNGVRDDAQVFRDLYNLERVEVLKGSVGMIFGRGGAGGVVNRVTKKPVSGRVGEASLTLGSYDQKRATLDYGNKLGDSAALRINAMAEGANNFVDGVDLRRWAVNPTLTYASYLNARVTQPFNSNTTATAVSLVPAGRKVGLVPEHTFSLWNKFNLGHGFGTGVGVIYQGASYTSFLNTVKLPSFTRADAALYYTLPGNKTRVSLNVENIFNKKYWPTVDGDNNISVGAPVNARITLSTAF